MTVTTVHKDPEALTLTITSQYDAPLARVWELWANPRLLERWWGPPTYPATFVAHELTAGAKVTYFMTGPEGDRAHGWWRVVEVEAPHRLELEDGFAGDDGEPNPDLPTMTIRVALDDLADGGTRMTIETTFPSQQAMEQVISMGMEEGMVAAIGQIDELLREPAGASQREASA
jgi:uncharacterized protein YndB with AHSA1/START domain